MGNDNIFTERVIKDKTITIRLTSMQKVLLEQMAKDNCTDVSKFIMQLVQVEYDKYFSSIVDQFYDNE